MKNLYIYALGFILLTGYLCCYASMPVDNDLNKELNSYLKSVQKSLQEHDTLSCFKAYRNIAHVYHELQQDEKQLECLLKAAEFAEKTKDIILLSYIYIDLGRYFNEVGDPEQTRYYYNKLLGISQMTDNKSELVQIYDNLARYYKITGDLTSALQFQQKALATTKELGITEKIASMHNALSELYLAENLQDSFVYHAIQAYNIAFGSGDSQTQAIASMRLSQHYQHSDYKKAIECGEIAYQKALESNDLELARDAAAHLSNLHESSGRYRESNIYIRRYHALADSLLRIEEEHERELLMAQMEYEQHEAELIHEIDERQEKLQNQKWLGVLMLCVLILTATLAYTNRKSSRTREAVNAILHEQKDELMAANEELLAVNEELSTVNDELNRTYKELERYKKHLEDLVRDRTSKLREALKQAQESDRFKAAFFANMSHEIRTPLNAILGFLQFIDDPSIDTDKREEMIELINSNSRQLLQMVDDIVTLSKIDSGLLTVQPILFNINDIFNKVMSGAQQIVKDTGKDRLELIVENRLPESLHSAVIDGKQVEMVFLQLINNAVKFTECGFVMFGCETNEDQSLLQFFVEDTGIGISDEHKTLIFKRFWKQGDLYTQEYRGIGIGLSLCEELVRLMGGTLSVESIPDEGSTFRFAIPYERSL